MKNLTLIFLLLSCELTFAQEIEIKVLNKNSEPMPYAYILINGKPVTVSDTLGKAVIPINILRDKDTIGVSYLGTLPISIVFNDSLKFKGKHSFFLDESGFALNEVFVTYVDVEKLLKNSIKDLPVIFYDCKLSANFHYDFVSLKNNQSTKIISGILEATNNPRFEPKHWNWFDPPLRFITINDTNRLEKSLNFNTHTALWFTNLSVHLWQLKNKRAKPIYSYLGEQDSFKVFRISYPKSFIQNFYYQTLLYVDKQTKFIRHVEIDAYNDEPLKPPSNIYQYRFSLKYDCEIYTHKKPKRTSIYFPTNITYVFQTLGYSNINLTLSDLEIKNNK
jgi:hypothetical protein